MNCKPGDFAIVIRSLAGNEGALCEVLDRGDIGYNDPCWRVRWLSRMKGFAIFPEHFPDSFLRPLRPDAGDDETLSWKRVPVPSQEPSHV